MKIKMRGQSDEDKRSDFSLRSALYWGLALGIVVGLIANAAKVAEVVNSGVLNRLAEGANQLLPSIVVAGIAVGVLGWFFLFKLTGRRRWIGAALSILAVVIGGAVLRVDSFYGSVFPRFAWRWSATPEDLLNEYLKATKKDPKAGEASLQAVKICLASSGDDFPAFRGASRLGFIHDANLSRDWKSNPPRQLWQHPIGYGWSSFSVVGDYAFTQEQRGPNEVVVCYELLTGREIWVVTDPVEFHPSHGDGPRATPTIHQEKVYTVGATGILNCIDGTSGTRLWRKKLLPDPESQNLTWGMAGSPLVVNDLLIVSPGLAPDHSLIAFDLNTGEEVWASGGDAAAYASPLLTSLGDKPQILIFNGSGLAANDPVTGNHLWSYPWETHGNNMANIAQPVVPVDYGSSGAPNQVLISSGYGVGCVLLQVDLQENEFTVREVWKNRNIQAKFANMVVSGKHLFGLDNGILVCIDLVTGDRVWKRGRYGHGQLLLVDDLLLIQAESGDVVLVEASPEGHLELGRFEALTSKTWNPMALAGNILVVRNDREAAAYELP